MTDTTTTARPSLVRALGRWDLTAIGVNQVIGSGIFLLPALVAANVGAWSPWAVLAVGGLSLVIALCFAEAGSRFDATGGPYLFIRAALGRFVGFETGWMLWFVRAASWASVINGLADALSFYFPVLVNYGPRATLITAVIAAICYLNVIGIKQSAIAVNTFTVAKLVPLAVFVLVGAFYVNAEWLRPAGTVSWASASSSALFLVFAYGGYEVVPVTAGETRDPARMIPFALVMTIAIVAAFMTAVQVVALGTLPGLGASRTPLADASVLFMGAAGGFLLTVGAVVSMTGNNVGQALTGSRSLFALGEQGDLPPFFGRVHPRHHTPANAILITSGVALALALTGSFATLAAGSAIARLVVYAGTCVSVLVLRRPSFDGRVRPASFTIPGGPVLPIVGLIVSVAIIAGASTQQLVVGLGALVAGAVLFVAAAPARRPEGGE